MGTPLFAALAYPHSQMPPLSAHQSGPQPHDLFKKLKPLMPGISVAGVMTPGLKAVIAALAL
jgi:hypothetical protein